MATTRESILADLDREITEAIRRAFDRLDECAATSESEVQADERELLGGNR